MLNIKQKYRNRIALLVLSAYLIISTLIIFHHHSYDFNQRESVQESGSSDPQLQIVNYSEFKCLLIQNFSSLHSINFNYSLHLTLDLNNKQELLLVQNDFLPKSNFLKSTNLRAPPENFS